MDASARRPNLERLAAEQVAGHLKRAHPDSSLAIDSSAALCDILELLVPEVLGRTNPEWQNESIDGFFFSSAVKTGNSSAELSGTCILISDQAVTPFALSMRLVGSHAFESLRIRLGEPGSGPLGISGPACNSRAAMQMLEGLNARLNTVRWRYDVTIEAST